MKDAAAADVTVDVVVATDNARYLAGSPLVVKMTRRYRHRQLYHRRST